MEKKIKARELFKVIVTQIIYSEYEEREVQNLAFLIMQDVFGIDYVQLILNKLLIISNRQEERILNIIEKLNSGFPIQYVLEYVYFYGYRFKINSSCLIPRPETEGLVDTIIKSMCITQKLNILDIGTGSGCIAIVLKKNFVNSTVSAIDISNNALILAKENAKILEANINFYKEDIFSLHDSSKDVYDVIVSNPPYVLESEAKYMRNIVLKNEPHQAIFVSDLFPIVFYEAIANYSKQTLKDNGFIFFEINEKFSLNIKNMLLKNGFIDVRIIADINSKDRIICCRYKKIIKK